MEPSEEAELAPESLLLRRQALPKQGWALGLLRPSERTAQPRPPGDLEKKG